MQKLIFNKEKTKVLRILKNNQDFKELFKNQELFPSTKMENKHHLMNQ